MKTWICNFPESVFYYVRRFLIKQIFILGCVSRRCSRFDRTEQFSVLRHQPASNKIKYNRYKQQQQRRNSGEEKIGDHLKASFFPALLSTLSTNTEMTSLSSCFELTWPTDHSRDITWPVLSGSVLVATWLTWLSAEWRDLMWFPRITLLLTNINYYSEHTGTS